MERNRRKKEGMRERGAHRGVHKENTSPKALTGKKRGADFCEILQPVGSKTRVFEVCSRTSAEP